MTTKSNQKNLKKVFKIKHSLKNYKENKMNF